MKRNHLWKVANQEPPCWTAPFVGILCFLALYYLNPEAFLPLLESLPLAKIIGGGALITIVIQNLRAGRPWLICSQEVGVLLVFVAIMILGIPFSVWPSGAMQVLLEKVVKIVLLVFLMTNAIESVRQVRVIIRMMVVCGSVIALTGITNYVSGNVDRFGRLLGYGTKEFANPNDFSLGLAIIIPLGCTLFLEEKSLFRRAFYLGAVLVMCVGIILSLSRGGLVTLMLLASIAIYSYGKVNLTKAFSLSIGILLILVIAFGTVPVLSDRAMSIFDNEKDETGSRAARVEHMWDGFNIMLENPLLGVGIGQSIIEVAKRHEGTPGNWIRIHNLYLEVGAEVGIPGLVVLLWLVVTTYRRLLAVCAAEARLLDQRSLQAYNSGLRVALLAFCFAAFFHPVSYNWFLYILIGLSGAVVKITARHVASERRTFAGKMLSWNRGSGGMKVVCL